MRISGRTVTRVHVKVVTKVIIQLLCNLLLDLPVLISQYQTSIASEGMVSLQSHARALSLRKHLQ